MSAQSLARQIENLGNTAVVPNTTNVVELNVPLTVDRAVVCGTTLAVTGASTLTGGVTGALAATGAVSGTTGTFTGALVAGVAGTNNTIAGLLQEGATNAITAFATGGQTNATAMTTQFNRVSTVATAADSVRLPASAAGLCIFVQNAAALPMQVFGAGTDTINLVATATGVSQMPLSLVMYTCTAAGNWTAHGLGTGYSGSLETLSATNAITAFATGGQGSAVALTTGINRVTVCATAGDSVKLPTSVAGMTVVVTNSGAAACDVFPVTSDLIDNLAVNLALRINTGTTAVFTCAVAGTWNSSSISQPNMSWLTNTTTTTFLANQLTGGAIVSYVSTAATPGSIATRTATQMFNETPNAKIGGTYLLFVTNTAASNVMTITAGGGVTLTGTATVAGVTTRVYFVTFTSQTALVMQNVFAFLGS